MVLEGGSIDVNGRGLLLTTEECLLSDVQCRNPGMTRADYERVFAEYLGVRKVLWLNRGIVGDDTHGHVDDLGPASCGRHVVVAVETDPADENYRPRWRTCAGWRRRGRADGGPLRVPLPMPLAVVFDGERLPASYANFYIANGVVLVPTFNDPNDRVALNTLAELMPSHRVVGISCGRPGWDWERCIASRSRNRWGSNLAVPGSRFRFEWFRFQVRRSGCCRSNPDPIPSYRPIDTAAITPAPGIGTPAIS